MPPGSAHPEADLGSSASCIDMGKHKVSQQSPSPRGLWGLDPFVPPAANSAALHLSQSSPDLCPSQHPYLPDLPLYPTVFPCLFLPKPAQILPFPSNSSPWHPPRIFLHYLETGCVSPLACGAEALLGALGPAGSWDCSSLQVFGVCPPSSVALCSSVCRVKAFNHRT